METKKPPMRRNGLIIRVARWSARHRWTAIVGWLLFVAAAIVVGGVVGTTQLDSTDTAVGESRRADKAVAGAYFNDKPTEMVLIQPRGAGTPSADEITTVVAELRQRYTSAGGVAAVADPVTSADGHSALVAVSLDTGNLTAADRGDLAARLIGPVLDATATVARQHPNLRIEQVGDTSITTALNEQVGDDLRRAELTSVPITLAILLVAFGALLAAGIPVLLALTSVAGALGMAALASQLMPMDASMSSVVLLIGMAVGVDYSLFYLRRERQERARGRSTRDSIEIAAATSGRAVIVSGITVLIAMAGLFVADNPIFNSMAVGTMLVVTIAMLGSVTVLPALLALLGDKIDRLRIPLPRWLRRGDEEGSRSWRAILTAVLARPGLSLALGVAAMLAVAWPALDMNLKPDSPQDLPRSVPIMQSYDRLNAAFPNRGDSHTVVITSTTGSALSQPQITAAFAELVTRAQATGLFAADPAPLPRLSADGRVAAIDLAIADGSASAGAATATVSLSRLRQELLPESLGQLSGVWFGVTGNTAGNKDFSDKLAQRLPWVFAFVLGLTFLVMLATFRSVVIAVTSVVLNLLSVAAAYGLLVLVFQRHWAEGLLGFRSNGGVVSWLPMFLFVVLFGLSMDYHVFLVSRICEAAARGLSTKDAIREGVARSASTVTSAAVVMVAVFAIFGTLSLLTFKQLGVGLAAAVLIDATIVRVVLLPAAMMLLGRANWYLPSWLRWLPRLDHGSSSDSHDDAAPGSDKNQPIHSYGDGVDLPHRGSHRERVGVGSAADIGEA